MKLINGKFYEGDIEVKPEFGNWTQINLLKEYEKRMQKGYLEVRIDEEEIITYFPSITYECPSCQKSRFLIFMNLKASTT